MTLTRALRGGLLLTLGGMMAGPAGAGPAQSPPGAPEGAGATARPTVEHEGQVFALAGTATNRNVETDEYVAEGEKLTAWTQLVTVQRLTLAASATTDEFLAYFQKRVAEDGASLEVLKQTRGASVFVVRFPASERNEEQVMICLGFVERTNPARLNLIQYAIKPNRVPVRQVETRITSWRDKFLHQARVIEASFVPAN